MDANKAKKIIEKETSLEVTLITDSTKGWDHKVYIAQTKKGCFVLRVPIKDRNKIKIQAWVCSKWFKLRVPVPKPVVLRKHYLIEECIPGKDLQDSRLTKIQKKIVYQKLCKYLKKMHTVKTRKYGPLIKPGIGKYDSWKKYIDFHIKSRLKVCLRRKLLTKNKAEKIKKEFNIFKDYFSNFKDPRLVHADLCSDNIMIKNNKLSGIIDAADASSGDSLCDYAAIIFENPNKYFLNWLNKKYGKTKTKIMCLYAIFGCFCSLSYHTKKSRLQKLLNLL